MKNISINISKNLEQKYVNIRIQNGWKIFEYIYIYLNMFMINTINPLFDFLIAKTPSI